MIKHLLRFLCSVLYGLRDGGRGAISTDSASLAAALSSRNRMAAPDLHQGSQWEKRGMRLPLLVAVAVATLGGATSCVRPPLRTSEEVHPSGFVQTDAGRFIVDGRPYHFLGANFWAAMNLASAGEGGDRARLTRELDRLAALGVKNLRILASSEGPNTAPWRVVPALQVAPGVYDEALLDGLDYLLEELAVRDMKAVLVLGNFWQWSGGFGQYLVWAGAPRIPDPQPWEPYGRFAATFYTNPSAMALYERHVRKMVTRRNARTGVLYRDDPTIMTWELANEPWPIGQVEALQRWADRSSRLIRELDPNHLITVGADFKHIEIDLPAVSYGTVHIFPTNHLGFMWWTPDLTYEVALEKTREELDQNVAIWRSLGKPLVMEEFGLGRDGRSYDPQAALTVRDRFFIDLLDVVHTHVLAGDMAGANFWAWAGEGRPVAPFGSNWKAGQAFTGDAPHEPQGWYSVYDTDESTIQIIRDYAQKFRR